MKYISNLVNFLVNNKTAFRDFAAVILLRLNLIPEKFNEISHQNTIYFFEVPNCTSNVLKIHPPHTYYFSRKFFYNYFYKPDYCETFHGLDEAKNDEGNIIRFLSKSKIKEILNKKINY